MPTRRNWDKAREAKKRERDRRLPREREPVLPTDIIGCDDDRECVHLNHEGIKMISPSGKAALLVIDGEEKWIPLSQIMDASDDSLTITLWFAEKEGLA